MQKHNFFHTAIFLVTVNDLMFLIGILILQYFNINNKF